MPTISSFYQLLCSTMARQCRSNLYAMGSAPSLPFHTLTEAIDDSLYKKTKTRIGFLKFWISSNSDTISWIKAIIKEEDRYYEWKPSMNTNESAPLLFLVSVLLAINAPEGRSNNVSQVTYLNETRTSGIRPFKQKIQAWIWKNHREGINVQKSNV